MTEDEQPHKVEVPGCLTVIVWFTIVMNLVGVALTVAFAEYLGPALRRAPDWFVPVLTILSLTYGACAYLLLRRVRWAYIAMLLCVGASMFLNQSIGVGGLALLAPVIWFGLISFVVFAGGRNSYWQLMR